MVRDCEVGALASESRQKKMRLAASRTGNQTESLTRLAQRVREPNKLLLHAASLASGSLHARCEPGSGGAETNQALGEATSVPRLGR